jgi:hypothetical protein
VIDLTRYAEDFPVFRRAQHGQALAQVQSTGHIVPGQDLPHGKTIDEVDVELACEVPSFLNGGNPAWERTHKRVRLQHNAVAEAFEQITRPEWPEFHIALVRMGGKRLDEDNLLGAFKAIRDGVSRWIGWDDADPRIRWTYAQRVVKKKDKPNGLKSWARVRLTSTERDLAQDESIARVGQARRPPQTVGLDQARFVQKPRAIPELAGGKPERAIDLHPRANGVSSRMRVRLMRCTRDEGVGRGVLYVHLSLFWTDTRAQRWRSQGISVRQEEIWDLVTALESMAEGLGLVRPTRGYFSGESDRAGTDIPSNNAKNNDVGKSASPFPSIPAPWNLQASGQEIQRANIPGNSSANIPGNSSPNIPSSENSAGNIPGNSSPNISAQEFTPEYFAACARLEDHPTITTAEYTRKETRNRPKEEMRRAARKKKVAFEDPTGPELDCNAEAEGADEEK